MTARRALHGFTLLPDPRRPSTYAVEGTGLIVAKAEAPRFGRPQAWDVVEFLGSVHGDGGVLGIGRRAELRT